MIAESEITKKIAQGLLTLGPLRFRNSKPRANYMSGKMIDAILAADWNGSSVEFGVEIKARSTPKNVRSALLAAKSASSNADLFPMIVVPYLSDAALAELERERVSGLDLCGNGLVIVPGKWFIRQSGARNRYPDSALIRNVYRGRSSQAARVFLLRPRYDRIQSILQEIVRRSAISSRLVPPITLATVSKVVKSLEEDLIVARKKDEVLLLQPEKLLDLLAENYRSAAHSCAFGWRIHEAGRERLDEALRKAFQGEVPAVMTGLGSTARYASMQRGEPPAIYSADPDAWLSNLPGARDERFPTVRMIGADEAQLYFDARESGGIIYASPIQTYLELRRGDKRDQEAALQVKNIILRDLSDGGQWNA